jgi:hypothetical protein
MSQVDSGRVWLRFVAPELFVEVHSNHVRGATQHALKRSILIGVVVTLLIAPVALIHWGEPDFRCCELPLVGRRRCLDFGLMVFIVLMWRILGVLPLEIPPYVKACSWSMCWYLGCCGLLDTVVLIAHRPIVKFWCDLILLTGNASFYGSLTIPVQRPAVRQLPACCALPIGTMARLKAGSSFFEQVAAAHERGRTSDFRRGSLLASKPWFHEPKQLIPFWRHGLGLWDDLTHPDEVVLQALRE